MRLRPVRLLGLARPARTLRLCIRAGDPVPKRATATAAAQPDSAATSSGAAPVGAFSGGGDSSGASGWAADFLGVVAGDSQLLFAELQLSTFSQAELREAFLRADANADGALTSGELRAALGVREGKTAGEGGGLEDAQIDLAVGLVMRSADGVGRGGEPTVSLEAWLRCLTSLAEARDPRIWPLSASMLVAGTAIGIVLPLMPLLVNEMGLTPAQYGQASAGL